eukprot:TRINITY_DN6988_c0_g1_i3.p1 TRINITY_DN6988_c0_g1~~TRINITY_DN6988_c0_g1_i3.p1  ORF type:complete len:225 (+),score=-9.36 TRINITY_DN6988_c0_g1_i3:87-677(+)
MAYNMSNCDDSRYHNSFHTNTQYASCLRLDRCLGSCSLVTYHNDAIFHLNFHSSLSLKMRAKLLWEYLQLDHGFVFQDFDPDKFQLFGFLDTNVNKIVGLCFVEEVTSANRIILNPLHSSSYSISVDLFPSQFGIVRLWVHHSHRRRNIATDLVNYARSRLITGKCISIHQVSFSQPSPDGVRFAIKYTGRQDFLI